jgi:uncharacterized membrane protein
MEEPSLQVQSPAFRRVPSGRGAEWWSSAWQLMFHRGAAAAWIVMCLIAIVIYLVLHLVPLLGSIAAQIVGFLFLGALMAAARKTEQGTAPPVGDLFAGFGPSLGPLATGAVLLLVVVLLIFGALAIAGGGALLSAFFGGATGNLALMAGAGATWLLLLLVALLLLLPVGMAAWLAPALIVLRQQPPVEALKASLAACWANLGALTVYGLLWIAFAIVASIPFGLGWLVLAPLTVLSTYAAYQDLFEAGDTAGSPARAGQG